MALSTTELAASRHLAPQLEIEVIVPSDPETWDGAAQIAVLVSMIHPASHDESAALEPVRIGSTQQNWSDAVKLIALGPDGATIDWCFERSASPVASAIELAPDRQWRMCFILPAKRALNAKTGSYQLRSMLEVASGVSWRGRVESPVVTVKLISPSSNEVANTLRVDVVGAEALAPSDP
jgi:hypothetical protein